MSLIGPFLEITGSLRKVPSFHYRPGVFNRIFLMDSSYIADSYSIKRDRSLDFHLGDLREQAFYDGVAGILRFQILFWKDMLSLSYNARPSLFALAQSFP